MNRGTALVVLTVLLSCLPLAAQDELAAGSGLGLPGATVAIPIFIRDVAGTPLDENAGPNLGIQGFGFRIDFSPASALDSSNFIQAGVTSGKNPVFPFISPAADHIVVLLSFRESTDALDFNLDAPLPGDQVGELVLEISNGAVLGTTVVLSLDPVSAELVNDQATISESVAAGTLAVLSGELLVQDPHIFSDGFETGDTGEWD